MGKDLGSSTAPASVAATVIDMKQRDAIANNSKTTHFKFNAQSKYRYFQLQINSD
jgi:hypothetical protein